MLCSASLELTLWARQSGPARSKVVVLQGQLNRKRLKSYKVAMNTPFGNMQVLSNYSKESDATGADRVALCTVSFHTAALGQSIRA